MPAHRYAAPQHGTVGNDDALEKLARRGDLISHGGLPGFRPVVVDVGHCGAALNYRAQKESPPVGRAGNEDDLQQASYMRTQLPSSMRHA
jgi:hypothetical protein